MNMYCAVGRLTRDPIVRFEGEGVQTATETLLIEEPGKLKPFTLYVPLSFWGRPHLHQANACKTLQSLIRVS